MGRPLMPCTRCGGPRRLEQFQNAELEACTQCGAVTLTRAELLSLSGQSSPIPSGGLVGLSRHRAHPTLMPEDELLDDLRESVVASMAPTDEQPSLPGPSGQLEQPVEVLKESDERPPLRVDDLPDASLAGPRPATPSPAAPRTDLLPEEPDTTESDWGLPPPSDEVPVEPPIPDAGFDDFRPETDEVPTTIDQSWELREKLGLNTEPEPAPSSLDIGGLSARDELQVVQPLPPPSDQGEEVEKQDRMLMLIALALVFLVGVPLIAYGTITVLKAQSQGSPQVQNTTVPKQTMADALTPAPSAAPSTPAAPASGRITEEKLDSPTPTVEPKPLKKAGARAPADSAVKSKVEAVAPAPKPKNFAKAGWDKVDSDTAGAAALFRRALDVRPGDPDAHYGLGYVLLQQGDVAGAVPHLCRAQKTGSGEVEREITGLLATKGLACE